MDATIALLEVDPSFQGLHIAQSGFSLNTDPYLTHADHRIPGSTVAGQRERHLRAPGHPRRDP